MLKLKTEHPALHNLALRRAIRTLAPEKHYAILRTARELDERVIVVMNFQAEPQRVEVDLSGVNCTGLTDLSTNTQIKYETIWAVQMPAFGYGFYRIT